MDNKLIGNENSIIFYTDEEGNLQIEVVLQDEDVWLNVKAIAELFDVQRPAITKHINNIYNENELEEKSTCSKMEHMGNMHSAYYLQVFGINRGLESLSFYMLTGKLLLSLSCLVILTKYKKKDKKVRIWYNMTNTKIKRKTE